MQCRGQRRYFLRNFQGPSCFGYVPNKKKKREEKGGRGKNHIEHLHKHINTIPTAPSRQFKSTFKTRELILPDDATYIPALREIFVEAFSHSYQKQKILDGLPTQLTSYLHDSFKQTGPTNYIDNFCSTLLLTLRQRMISLKPIPTKNRTSLCVSSTTRPSDLWKFITPNCHSLVRI